MNKGGKMVYLAGTLFIAAWFWLSSCSPPNPYYDPEKPHHTPHGFRNNHPTPPQGSFMKWRWERMRDGLPHEPENGYHIRTARPDAGMLNGEKPGSSITWLGHATLLVRRNGKNILTDPQFSQRASPFSFLGPKRRTQPALALDELPRIDIVVISHNHYDHLDEDSVMGLAAQPGGPPRFFVPLGLKPWFASRGIDTVTEMDWWDQAAAGDVELVFVPTRHFSARSLWDRNETLWGGWVIRISGFNFAFLGDTGYSADFKAIGRRLGRMDLTAIPIGAYDPRWFMKEVHVNPEEAVRIHQEMGTRYSLAMHWGAFPLTDEPLDEPPQRLSAALGQAGLPERSFLIPAIGETLLLEPLLSEDWAGQSTDCQQTGGSC
ncbi:MAG: MBL fold metallo-hydrolase [Deltaproteobacteria bacterium]|nr:MBL fold metallo-hydrolase [Deltaproteobacteria bacterium]